MELTDTRALDVDEVPDGRGVAPGQLFRGLRIHSVLGRGSMGQAYLASHPVLQVPLVVKTFRAADPGDLFAEAHLAARVASPRVVPVLDAGVEGSLPFVTQAYVDGIDVGELLTWYLQMGRRLPLATTCRLLSDVAEGLHAIHQAGVVHRDVKPSNLFLRGDGAALVGDFGVARPVGAGDGVVSGTPHYMAPEMWRGGRVDRRADVYALGATAHLLAVGEHAFSGQTREEMARQHADVLYSPPITDSPEAAYLFAVIARCLGKDPADRYPSAAAVGRELATVRRPAPAVAATGPDHARVGELTITLLRDDLAEEQADVLVNAANPDLSMRLGVARALRDAGGDGIEAEAVQSAPVAMGDVVWTGAGRLRAGHVAHAVAATGGAICLQRATLRTLLGAEARGARSVAFPALGTGVGDVPMEQAAQRMLSAVRTFAGLEPRSVRDVRVVLFDEPGLERWREILRWIQ